MNEPTLFRYVDHALRFAFEQEHRVIMNQTHGMVSPRRSTRFSGLSPHDLHAQAAMIRQRVQSFPHLERHYLQAHFGYDLERHEGMEVVVNWVIAQQPTGVYVRRAFRMMIEQYIGRGRFADSGIGHVRKLLKCRKQTALDVRKHVWLQLDTLRARAVEVAEGSFKALGLVEAN